MLIDAVSPIYKIKNKWIIQGLRAIGVEPIPKRLKLFMLTLTLCPHE